MTMLSSSAGSEWVLFLSLVHSHNRYIDKPYHLHARLSPSIPPYILREVLGTIVVKLPSIYYSLV